MGIRRGFVTLMLLVLPIAGQAYEKFGPYAGVGVGKWEAKLPLEDESGTLVDLQGDDTSFRVFGGYRFKPWLAAEFAFSDYGKLTDDFEGERISVGPSGFGPFLVLTLPLGRFEILARAGFILYDLEIRIETPEGSFGFSESHEAAVYGGGIGVMVFRNINLRLEYEVLDLEYLDDSNNVWLTAAWRFL